MRLALATAISVLAIVASRAEPQMIAKVRAIDGKTVAISVGTGRRVVLRWFGPESQIYDDLRADGVLSGLVLNLRAPSTKKLNPTEFSRARKVCSPGYLRLIVSLLLPSLVTAPPGAERHEPQSPLGSLATAGGPRFNLR